MPVQLTIIGLGKIGASIGLALANRPDLVQRTGHDIEPAVMRRAKARGAIDRAEGNLFSAIRNADLVILAIPMDQIRETISLIASDLKEGAVIMDTAPIKESVIAWIGEMLPPDRYYVGLTPVLNPMYMHSIEAGVEAARADLFRGSTMAIVTPSRSSSEAIKLSTELVHLLGATPMFADPAEIDGVMATIHLLPQVLAATLLNLTIDKPGWREGQKLAGQAYASLCQPISLSSPQALSAGLLLNRENSLRVISNAINVLHELWNELQNEDAKALERRLEQAYSGREKWWGERLAGNYAVAEATPDNVELPTSSEMFGRLFGLGRKPKQKKS